MTKRLGWGEYDCGLAEMEARVHFLAAIEKLAPHVLTELREEMLPLVPLDIEGYALERYWWEDLEFQRFVKSEHFPAVEALHKWADRHKLNQPWLLEAAAYTMRQMQIYEAHGLEAKCVSFVLRSMAHWCLPTKELVFGFEPWKLEEETRSGVVLPFQDLELVLLPVAENE